MAPVTVLAVRLNVLPVHSGPLLEADGVAGVAFTVTLVVPAALPQPPLTTVNE